MSHSWTTVRWAIFHAPPALEAVDVAPAEGLQHDTAARPCGAAGRRRGTRRSAESGPANVDHRVGDGVHRRLVAVAQSAGHVVREVDAEPLERPVVVGAVRVVHGGDERGVAAIDTAAVVDEPAVDGLLVERAAAGPSSITPVSPPGDDRASAVQPPRHRRLLQRPRRRRVADRRRPADGDGRPLPRRRSGAPHRERAPAIADARAAGGDRPAPAGAVRSRLLVRRRASPTTSRWSTGSSTSTTRRGSSKRPTSSTCTRTWSSAGPRRSCAPSTPWRAHRRGTGAGALCRRQGPHRARGGADPGGHRRDAGVDHRRSTRCRTSRRSGGGRR